MIFPRNNAVRTKRGLLRNLATIYDPLGLVSPLTLKGKFIFRDVCISKVAWDAQLPEQIAKECLRLEKILPQEITTPRCITGQQEQIEEMELHAFDDAGAKAKQGLTIPRLELVAAHMAHNLIINVKQALEGMPVTQLHGWIDSLVVLHWLKGEGQYKQFVANRVSKMQSHPGVSWHHVPTEENPANLGSRGGHVTDCKPWWSGPVWLSNKGAWPPDILIRASTETQAEAKATKELFARSEATNDPLDEILAKFTLTKTMRVTAWVTQFTRNIRLPKQERVSGPLTTQEMRDQHTTWTKRAQANHETR